MKMRDWLISGGLLAAMLPTLAHAELVVIVNKDNPATKMYLTQVSQFYLGGLRFVCTGGAGRNLIAES